MNQDMQRVAAAIGKSGCYFLSLFQLSEIIGAVPADPFRLFRAFELRKWVDSSCFMLDPAAIMSYLTSQKWQVRKAGPEHELPLDYMLGYGEYEILRFERPLAPNESKTADTAHFVVGTGIGPLDQSRVLWDPWVGSATVRDGRLASRRIFGRTK